MKKIFATGVMGVMALSMPFVLTGCEIESAPAKSDAEAYVMLRDYSDEFKTVNGEKSYQNLIDMGKKTNVEFNFDESDLLPTTVTMLQSMGMANEKSNFNRKKEFYLDNNTGYSTNKVFDYDNLTYDIRSFDMTKKLDNKYVNYSYEKSGAKVASYVDSMYAKNTYKYNKLSADSPEVYAIFEGIKDNETLEDFSSSAQQIAADILSETSELNIPKEALGTVVDIAESNKRYTLTATITADDMALESDEYSTTTADVDVVFTITFDESGIIGSNAEMEFEQNTIIKSIMYSALLENGSNTEIDEDDVITMVGNVEMNFSMDFDASLNNVDVMMNHDCDDFLGTGTDNALENRKTNITINFVDANTKINGKYESKTPIDLTLRGCGVNTTEAIVIEGLYWDEEFTDKIEGIDKYPTYDATIYVKFRVADSYALVQTDSEYYDEMSGKTIYSYGIYNSCIINSAGDNYYYVNRQSGDYTLTKLTVNGVEVALNFNSSGSLELPTTSGEIYLLKAYYTK